MSSVVVPKPENIAQLVLFIRGEKVIVDRDLASLYGVSTKALNQAVKRKAARFPADFMFQLTKAEYEASRSQFVTGSKRSRLVFAAIKELIAQPAPTKNQIGFHP